MEIASKVLAQRGRNCGFLRRPEERMQVSGIGRRNNYFIRAPVELGTIVFFI